MNAIQIRNLIEPLEPEELECWTSIDFDDLFSGFEALEIENEHIA